MLGWAMPNPRADSLRGDASWAQGQKNRSMGTKAQLILVKPVRPERIRKLREGAVAATPYKKTNA